MTIEVITLEAITVGGKSTILPSTPCRTMVIGSTIAETFNRLYYFERAVGNYVQALQTGMPLRVLADEVAEKTAQQLEAYLEQDEKHFSQLKSILDREGSDYAD